MRTVAILGVGVLLAVCVARRDDLLTAIGAVPPATLAGLAALHLLGLVARSEAWRLSLAAIGGPSPSRRVVHTANAGAFVVGSLEAHATMPARIALLRRYGGNDSPDATQIALGDAPIFMFEVCTTALLAAVASTAVGAIPAWVPWAMLAAAIGILVALRVLCGRLRHRRFAAGLGVLARADLRNRLAIAVVAFTGAALLRTWIVLAAFGLPADPAHMCLVLFTMGTVGLLPIGVGTGPTATVVALGTTDLAAATAAGMVVSTATVLAVLIYAAVCWSWRALIPAPVTA